MGMDVGGAEGFQETDINDLIGESPELRRVKGKLLPIAQTDCPVLILGETGTGKEVCARLLHQLSKRKREPFLAENCGNLSAELIANELFGHESGAYTGAAHAARGIVTAAEHGTLFLDEVDSWPLSSQSAMLRLIQEKTYRPVGSTKTVKANVRILAATNVRLDLLVEQGKFRKDLYHRLNVFSICMPPLRERSGDVVLLAEYYLKHYTAAFQKAACAFTQDAKERLAAYHWPGNIRELQNVVMKAVVLSSEASITSSEIELPVFESGPYVGQFQECKSRVVEQFERGYISHMLASCGNSMGEAAQAAGKHPRAWYELVRKHHMLPVPRGLPTADKRSNVIHVFPSQTDLGVCDLDSTC